MIFGGLVASCTPVQTAGQYFYPQDRVQYFCDNLIKAIETGDYSFLAQPRGRKFEPVDVQEFIESKEYYGQKGHVWPSVMDDMWEIFHGKNEDGSPHYYIEIVLGGAIGVAKSYRADLILAYQLYDLSSYHNPQMEFGLAPGSSMVFIQQSKSLSLARKVVFDQFAARIRNSPYFKEQFMFDTNVKAELRFPNNLFVYPIGGSDLAALGMNVWGGCFPGSQTYVDSTGQLTRFDVLREFDRVLTINKAEQIVESNITRPVITGVKPLVRLLMGDNSSMVCTPDQKFKDITGNWIEAKNCAGVGLKVNELHSLQDSGISRLECMYVEDLGKREVVYDIECVDNSHLFFTPLTNSANSLVLQGKNCIDEMNFMLRTQDSVLLHYTGEDEYDQAERIYNQTIRRIKSRFMNHGRVPGKLVLVSSANYPDDFISRKAKESQTDPTIFCSIKAQWDMLPQDRYCGEKFLVELGSDTTQSRILVSRELASPESTILDVPVEYLPEFQRDIDGALRDLGGIPVGSNSPFLPEREKIELAQVNHEGMYGGDSLFNAQEVYFGEIGFAENPRWDEIINHKYLDQYVMPNLRYVVHVDVGLTQDALGIAIGHIGGYKIIANGRRWNAAEGQFIEMKDVHAPIYVIDGVLRCRAARGGEVDLGYVRDLITYLNKFLTIRWGTCDTFQSSMLLQAFKSEKIRSGPLSVDTSIAPYVEIKESLHDERLCLPRHKILAEELRELQRVVEKNRIKVEHPTGGGSKDCSDAVAGVVFMLQTKEASYKSARPEREALRHQTARQSRPRRMIHVGGRRYR